MLTNENRKQIIKNFLYTIEGIADKDYQKRIWIRGEGPEVDDFDETVCQFFQEGDWILKEQKDFGLTENQYRLLKHFRDEFKMFSEEHDLPEEFIDTPEWESIMNMAKGILKSFI